MPARALVRVQLLDPGSVASLDVEPDGSAIVAMAQNGTSIIQPKRGPRRVMVPEFMIDVSASMHAGVESIDMAHRCVSEAKRSMSRDVMDRCRTLARACLDLGTYPTVYVLVRSQNVFRSDDPRDMTTGWTVGAVLAMAALKDQDGGWPANGHSGENAVFELPLEFDLEIEEEDVPGYLEVARVMAR